MPKRLVASPTTYSLTSTTSTPALSSPIPTTFTDSLPLPKIIVFDLDYTLWPFWVDTHVSPPVKPRDDNTRMVDRWGESFSFYPGVPAILSAARQRGLTMGLASRTHTPDLARDMLRGLSVPQISLPETDGESPSENPSTPKPIKAIDHFVHLQIFPGSKVTHFRRIQEATRRQGPGREVAFADMLFFDDESRNSNVQSELGVTFWLVRDGVTRDEVDRGVWEWRKRRGISKPPASG